jgi:hypothetical protein
MRITLRSGSTHRVLALAVGAALWVSAAGVVSGSVYTVFNRATRATVPLSFHAEPGHGLAPGDGVFIGTGNGLERIGEVARVDTEDDTITLAIVPARAGNLAESTRATCWQTPLDAEEALTALLPPEVRRRAAENIAHAWREREEEVLAAWKPIAAELATAYFAQIGDDIEVSIRNHENELWGIGREHAEAAAAQWPEIQKRLQPILQEHLTPVLGGLMNDAVSEAPKTRVAWNLAWRDYGQAYELMLDWLTEYLANVPEADRAELRDALYRTWEAAAKDEVLVEHFRRIGRRVRDDENLRCVLAEIYREAIADNPQTARFLRSEVLQAPHIREEMYRFVELFAPTLRSVTALALFDEAGATRPEVVHLVRSIALNRKVAWVTLTVTDPDQPAARQEHIITGPAKENHP